MEREVVKSARIKLVNCFLIAFSNGKRKENPQKCDSAKWNRIWLSENPSSDNVVICHHLFVNLKWMYRRRWDWGNHKKAICDLRKCTWKSSRFLLGFWNCSFGEKSFGICRKGKWTSGKRSRNCFRGWKLLSFVWNSL
jgi:hypothetical protein